MIEYIVSVSLINISKKLSLEQHRNANASEFYKIYSTPLYVQQSFSFGAAIQAS